MGFFVIEENFRDQLTIHGSCNPSSNQASEGAGRQGTRVQNSNTETKFLASVPAGESVDDPRLFPQFLLEKALQQ
jgi:hypothetical protein